MCRLLAIRQRDSEVVRNEVDSAPHLSPSFRPLVVLQSTALKRREVLFCQMCLKLFPVVVFFEPRVQVMSRQSYAPFKEHEEKYLFDTASQLGSSTAVNIETVWHIQRPHDIIATSLSCRPIFVRGAISLSARAELSRIYHATFYQSF